MSTGLSHNRSGGGRAMIASINPATGETLKKFEPFTKKQIDETLLQAYETFYSYRRTSFGQREGMILRAAEILEAEKHEFRRLMTTDMGKPIKAAEQEVEKCAWVCRYYAENAKHHLGDQVIQTNATKSYVRFQPLGVVLA